MPGVRRLILGLASLLLLAPTALADPIQSFSATYSDSLGLSTSSPIVLPDLWSGGSVVLGTIPIAGLSMPTNSALSGTFDLQIGIPSATGQGTSQQNSQLALLDIKGAISGSVVGPTIQSAIDSRVYTGSGGTVAFPVGADVVGNYPQLQNLWQNIERVQILGQVITGSSGQSLLQTTLTIAPASFLVTNGDPNITPTPEPASVTVFLLAISGLAVRRRSLARRESVADR